MPKSQLAKSPLVQPAPAEWLLARVAGPTRATAILGDLLEISSTRGRLWFWIAYLRTLVSLGWRAPVAFLWAYICTLHPWLGYIIFGSLGIFHLIPPNDPAHAGRSSQMLLQLFLNAINLIIPFALVRFGRRDRFTQLACAIFLLTIPLYSHTQGGTEIADIAAAAAILAALSLPAWRRPMIVLAATAVPVAIANKLWIPVQLFLFAKGYGFASPYAYGPVTAFSFVTLYRTFELCIAAIACSLLHRLLLQKKQPNRLTLA